MTTTKRNLYYTNAKDGVERMIEVPEDLAWIMVQSMHIAGVNAYIDLTPANIVAAWLWCPTHSTSLVTLLPT